MLTLVVLSEYNSRIEGATPSLKRHGMEILSAANSSTRCGRKRESAVNVGSLASKQAQMRTISPDLHGKFGTLDQLID